MTHKIKSFKKFWNEKILKYWNKKKIKKTAKYCLVYVAKTKNKICNKEFLSKWFFLFSSHFLKK